MILSYCHSLFIPALSSSYVTIDKSIIGRNVNSNDNIRIGRRRSISCLGYRSNVDDDTTAKGIIRDRNNRENLRMSVVGASSPPSIDTITKVVTTTTRRSNDNANKKKSSSLSSDAAMWHKRRRREMLEKYGNAIRPLETDSGSYKIGIPLLVLTNLTLLGLSIAAKHMSYLQLFALSVFPGSICSLWQLQILHDNLHGTLWSKKRKRILQEDKQKNSSFYKPLSNVLSSIRTKKTKKKSSNTTNNSSKLRDRTLFWGSMPSVFGYYLYLKFGHLTHHKNLGDSQSSSLKELFDSDQSNFEDGDVLFVAHRMNLEGEIGPTIPLSKDKSITMSISKSGFKAWEQTRMIRNGLLFWSSFLFERFMLVLNDSFIVTTTGRNLFFPNKPLSFHRTCARYARAATAVKFLLWKFAGGYKSLLFLFLSETLWSLPPHPACAMFVSNHGSDTESSSTTDGSSCRPSSSTYAGKWYSLLTLGTNYHCEHHDFPNIPLHRLYRLHQIAPEYYNREPQQEQKKDNIWKLMQKAFSYPEWYACQQVGVGSIE